MDITLGPTDATTLKPTRTAEPSHHNDAIRRRHSAAGSDEARIRTAGLRQRCPASRMTRRYAPFSPKAEYQALPWRQIREQYETTDISLRALAMQWNIASKTTLGPQDHRRGLDPTHRLHRHHSRLLQVAEASDPSPAPEGEAEKIDGDTLRREADASPP